jgi:hypothetical protein
MYPMLQGLVKIPFPVIIKVTPQANREDAEKKQKE